jgi:hypothetical protein
LGSLGFWLLLVGCLRCVAHTAWCCWLAVISPELVMEVEARMNRQYTPPNLHPAGTTVPRSKAYPRPKKPTGLPTVQENNSRGKFPLDTAWSDLLVADQLPLTYCLSFLPFYSKWSI